MIRIGDFSRLSQVSVKTLRFYDEKGLLHPILVDPLTGYRYYDFHQLPRLFRILALKDLGFSLEEIGEFLRQDVTTGQLRGMLKLRQAEAARTVREDTERLQHVEARLRQIEEEDAVSKYDVVIKPVEALRVASVRGIVPTPPEQGPLWGELGAYLAGRHVRTHGACLALYHDTEYKERDWDIEACQPIDDDATEVGRVKIRTLPAVETMACTIHHGPFQTIGQAYEAIMKWIEVNGYRICGAGREVYVREAKTDPENQAMASQTDPDTVTEVQYPVEKAK